MIKISDIIECMQEMAPEELAEPWDNCGLLVASENESAERVIVCLDVTRAVVDEAIKSGAQLIVAHHPLIFTPIKRIDMGSVQGALLLSLIRNNIALYAAHTNVDKTYGGLNDLLAGLVGLDVPPPPPDEHAPLDYYRIGEFQSAMSAEAFNERVRSRLKLGSLIVSAPNGDPGGAQNGQMDTGGRAKTIKKVVVMCGSYSLEAEKFATTGADALLCGEIRHHEALELAGMGVHIIQAGHHGTERFFISLVEKWIADRYPEAAIQGVGFSSPPTTFYHGGGGLNDV
ncbi:MAG: Nif3-like dinuclear metal center hexameric protein [Oscillospiraceae bacterium]|nr:Nif3-like dinuclear metal center hexameric protein [Oscillospiraceae bacterium]